MKPLQKIKNQKLLLVEGQDEEVFFKNFLKKKNIDDIQIMSSGGKERFKKIFPQITKDDSFDKLSSLAVIHDADEDAQATFKSIRSVLQNNKLKSPDKISSFASGSPRVGIFIIPDGKNKGNLESLCLSTVESEDIMECVRSFMACIKRKSDSKNNLFKKPKNIHKAKCRAFLSAMEEDTSSLGIASEKGYWNLDSEKLNPLLDFLKKL